MSLQRCFPAVIRREPRRYRPTIGTLENRLLLTAGGSNMILANDLPAIPVQIADLYPLPADPSPGGVQALASTGPQYPLSAVPALSSLPGAPATLYLNFLGDSTPSYGQYTPGTTPAYDQDGDPTTFSAGELASIQKIWSYVAEDYAPFNINVTTVPPSDMSHGKVEKVDIGGTGGWMGGASGGLCYVNDFTMTGIPNVAFVFSQNLAGGNPKYTGDAVSHEAGHGFGLNHQSQYSGTALVQEYSTGPGNDSAPLMGNSYQARRSLWWYGTSDVSSTRFQDDMAILANANNGFGYRPYTVSSPASALPLAAQGSQLSGSGLIVTGSQQDFYQFTASQGPVSFTVSVPTDVSSLAPQIALLDAGGSTVIAAAGPSASDYSAHIDVNLPAGGSYCLMVTGGGAYGNVGHYTISGSINGPASTGGASGTGTGAVTLLPPASITISTPSSYRADLAWTDVAGETGFRVERSVDGVNWSIVGTTGMGALSFSDATVTPSSTYLYRVRAVGVQGVSAPSGAIRITTPQALLPPVMPPSPIPPTPVSNVTVASRLPRQIVLTWSPNAGTVSGYRVERSSNGRTWSVIGQTAAGTYAFSDGSVAPGKTYFYRVRAVSSWGLSPASGVARAVTPKALPLIRRKAR